MPKDLLDDKTKFPIAVRVPIDGDDANGANFELPYQQLADRTAYLREETETLGVRRVRRVADFPALRAVTELFPFDLRWVVGRGLYWYDAPAAGPEEEPRSIKPASAGGLWRHVDVAYRAEIERAFVPYNFFVPPLSTTSTAWTDSGLTVSLRAGRAGDRVHVRLSADFRADGGASLYRVLLVDGAGAAFELPETLLAMFPSAGVQARTLAAVHRLGANGDANVRVQFRAAAGGARAEIIGPATVVAELVRF
jgi:hypothetical protein